MTHSVILEPALHSIAQTSKGAEATDLTPQSPKCPLSSRNKSGMTIGLSPFFRLKQAVIADTDKVSVILEML